MEENTSSTLAMYTCSSLSAEELNKQDEEDDKLDFEEDPVYQVMGMLNFSDDIPFVLPPTVTEETGCREDVIFKTDGLNISKLLNSLECNNPFTDKVKGTNMEELFQELLETERRGRADAEDKLRRMVEFITFVHGEFGKLLKSMISIATKNLEVTNVLNLGPFEDERETDEFLGMLKALSDQFLDEFENLGKTKTILEKANRILAASAALTENNSSSTASENDEENSDYDKNQIHNEPSTSSSSFPPETTGTGLTATRNYSKRIPKRGRRNLYLTCANKPHGYDHSRRHGGHFCLCGTKYSSRVSLYSHVKYFTTDWKFRCEICNTRFVYASLLRKHMHLSHNIVDLSSAQFSCSKCGEEFENRAELFRHHRRLHNNKKTNVEEIEKFHTGFGRWRNPINEGRHGFDKRSNLNRCLCGAVYNHRSALWSHVTAKLHGKVFKCYLCPRRYDMHAHLKLHVRQFHKLEYEQGRYGCPVCGDTFPTIEAKNIHRLSAHGLRKTGRARKPKNNGVTGMTASQEAAGSGSEGAPPTLSPPHPVLVYVPINNVSNNVTVTNDVEDEDDEVVCLN